MSNRRKDDFPSKVVAKVAERAAYICSNPACGRITVGPVTSDPAKSTKTGVAAHICAASPGGPRYDMSQSSNERQSIQNAIWLCATCSTLVDKNKGVDYPADHLRKWKRDQEALIKECLEGNKRVMFQFHHLSLGSDLNVAREVLHVLEDKGALYIPYNLENPRFVMESLKELRSEITRLRVRVNPASPLSIITESIVRACRHYMNTTSENASFIELEYSLGAVRKIIGINIGDLAKVYKLDISDQLASIIPA
jgi:hypothetical protein